MNEQSPDQYVDSLERRFKWQRRLRRFLFDAAIGSARNVLLDVPFEPSPKTDTLPQD